MPKFKDLNREMPLYFAYGSNLFMRQMRWRCPKAKPLGKLTVRNHALVFRRVADMVPERGATIQGGLYAITPDCERSLDLYEGVAAHIYEKKYFKVTIEGRERLVLFYRMLHTRGIMPPSERYLDKIADGYVDFELPIDELASAVRHAWDCRIITETLRARHTAAGSPRLARADYLYREPEIETEKETEQ